MNAGLDRWLEQHAQPNFTEFKRRATRGNLVPVSIELFGDFDTPVSAYERVRKVLRTRDRASHTFLLESVEGGERIGRYSFIGGKSRAIVRAWGRRVVVQHEDGRTSTMEDVDPLEGLKQFMQQYRPVPDPTLPPFIGGAVGFLGYDCIHVFEPRVPVRTDRALRAPDMVFMVTDALIVFDRARQTMRLIANAYVHEDPSAAYTRALDTLGGLLDALRTPRPVQLTPVPMVDPVPLPASTMTREEFVRSVERAKEHIRAGDIIQVVLSQRFEMPFTGDSLDVYRALRWTNPSPYMFLLDLGESAMVGSSPEVHVRLDRGRAEIRPIAGTRPRAEDPETDAALERELLADPKERAEHIMLVDLARNDLGRVCRPGSVRVPELMVVERYSHVMHIVSDVVGDLAPDHDAYDLLRATFPAGTVTGAPKIRAMELIADLETARRGPYAGAVAYFSYDGHLDSCITIRTVILDEGRAFVQAGAGVVADSDPEREYEETCNKARALWQAIEMSRQLHQEAVGSP
jgi:anthranilate synthase component 1